VIAAPAGELEKIDGFLEGLRKRELPIVSIEARVLRGGERVKGSGVRYLDEAGFATFIGEISKTEGVTVVGAPALSCYNGQRAKISVGKERNYVSDLEVSFAEDGSLLIEPVIGKFFEGFELTLRPVLSVDRKFVTLVVDTRMRRLLDPPPDSLSPAARGKTVEIQLPELRETRRRNAVTLPVDHGVLLDLGTGPGEAESERLQILLRGSVIEMDEGK
jgi:hypothetical protein